RPERILAFASSQVTTLSGSCRYSSKRLSSSFSCSSVTGIASGLEDNSSQSSTAKANLSAVESFCSSGIFSLIMWDQSTVQRAITQLGESVRSGWARYRTSSFTRQTSIALEMRVTPDRTFLIAQALILMEFPVVQQL